MTRPRRKSMARPNAQCGSIDHRLHSAAGRLVPGGSASAPLEGSGTNLSGTNFSPKSYQLRKAAERGNRSTPGGTSRGGGKPAYSALHLSRNRALASASKRRAGFAKSGASTEDRADSWRNPGTPTVCRGGQYGHAAPAETASWRTTTTNAARAHEITTAAPPYAGDCARHVRQGCMGDTVADTTATTPSA